MASTAETARSFATKLLADGSERGLRKRALAEIERLSTDRSVSVEARAEYASIAATTRQSDALYAQRCYAR